MAVVITNLTGKEVTPPEMTDYALLCGARKAEGTDMSQLTKMACGKWLLEYKTTSDINVMLEAVQNGAFAICNVSGNRNGHEGIFSSGGHYVVCVRAGNGPCVVVDPGDYTSKFNTLARKNKVFRINDLLLCEATTLDEDCIGRSPKYYIIYRKKANV